MQLFVIYIGGEHPKARIELHDFRWMIAETIENCYPRLREEWWGDPKSLHLDAWGILKSADGFDIQLGAAPQESENKLYFVNLGGYDPGEFTELHKNVFVVAPSESKAKVKALKQIREWHSFHRDNQYEVEDVLCLSSDAAKQNLHIYLTPTDSPTPFEFECRYVPIGKILEAA